MKHLKTYEGWLDKVKNTIDNYLNKWEKTWSEVWKIPLKYSLVSLKKLMDNESAVYWNNILINDKVDKTRFFVLKDKKTKKWSSLLLDNIEIDTFKKLGIYKGEPELTQDDKDEYDAGLEGEKYNI